MNQSSQNTIENIRIGFVQARWHADIVDEACKAFIAEIGKRTNRASQVDVFDVPGAFEIPLQARMLARAAQYDAIVACAFVVDGGIACHVAEEPPGRAGSLSHDGDATVGNVAAIFVPRSDPHLPALIYRKRDLALGAHPWHEAALPDMADSVRK